MRNLSQNPLFLLVALSVLISNWCLAQNPQLIWHHYTTEDGLPSNEVYYSLQTPDGYMWFATDNGLSRFDGYAFKNYGSPEGLKNPAVFNLQLDPQGRLWMATLGGDLYFMEGDSIYPSIHNDTIQALLQTPYSFYRGSDFRIDERGHIFLPIQYVGILEIEAGGNYKVHRVSDLEKASTLVKQFGDDWIAAFCGTPSNLKRDEHTGVVLELHPVEVVSTDTTFFLLILPFAWEISAFWPFVKDYTEDITALIFQYSLVEFNDGGVTHTHRVAAGLHQKTVVVQADGSVLCGFNLNRGLRWYQNYEALKTEEFDHYLSDQWVTHVHRDERAHLWVSTLTEGVFYCSNPDWRLYDQSVGLPTAKVSSLAIKSQQEVFFGLHSGGVVSWHADQGVKNLSYPYPKQVIQEMLYVPEKERLLVAGIAFIYHQNGKWHERRYLDVAGNFGASLGKSIHKDNAGDSVWVATVGGVYLYESAVDSIVYVSKEDDFVERVFDVHRSSDGTLLLGTMNGLLEMQNDSVFQPMTGYNEFAVRAESLSALSDETLVVGTKGEGVLFVKGQQFMRLTTADGLTSSMIEKVYVDERDQIWVATLNGLNKISGFSWDNDHTLRIRQFRTQHGLPSNEVTDIEVLADQVWVATSKGVVSFRDIEVIDSFSLAPQLMNLTVNDQMLPIEAGLTLAFDQNNLVFEFLTLNLPQKGQIPYRYRLLPTSTDWKETPLLRVNYSALAPGDYTFQVQSANRDDIWSATTTYSFRIQAPWWQRWWARLSAALVIAALLFSWYKGRTGRLKKEITTQKQLARVEREALRSQMNPHFIFNALNAIQGQIALGDKAAANRYLSRFARLIRGALQHSRLTKVPLEDDLRQLESYLELEQIRFRHSFQYEVHLAEGLDTAGIEIPPLLIQPFVENAVVHGLAQQERPGLIELYYRQEDDYLIVLVRDNGIGIEAAKRRKGQQRPGHQSIGLSVTRRRLEMLNQEAQTGKVKLRERKNQVGEVLGTEAEVWIPLG